MASQPSPLDGEVWVQLATRIPKPLHRTLKLHCVQEGISVMEFVCAALQEKLGAAAQEPSARPRRRRSA